MGRTDNTETPRSQRRTGMRRRRPRHRAAWWTATLALTGSALLAGCGASHTANAEAPAHQTASSADANAQSGPTSEGRGGGAASTAGPANQAGANTAGGTSGAAASGSQDGRGSGSNPTHTPEAGSIGETGNGVGGTRSPAAGWSLVAGGGQTAAYPLQNAPGFAPDAVQFVDSAHGWLVGPNQIYATSDGGRRWAEVYQTSAQTILRVDFVNRDTGFALMTAAGSGASGLALWQTSDGGRSWQKVTPASAADALPGALQSGQQVQIRFLDARTGFVFLSGTTAEMTGASAVPAAAYETTDGGQHWRALPVPKGATAVAYADAGHGTALVSGGTQFQMERTSDGGATWQTVLQKSTQNDVTGQVWMDTPRDIWVQVIGGYGMMQEGYTLFHSADAGATWSTPVANATAGGGPAPGVPNAGPATAGPGLVADDIDVVDEGHAFEAGVSLPTGPYGIVSTGRTGDGVHWQNGPDGFPGSFGAISFVNDQQGWLVTRADNRFADVFATVDGGANWSLIYQFVLSPQGVQNGRLTPIAYTANQLQEAGQTGQRDGIPVWLPTLGLDNDALHIVKTDGDGSIGLVYNHIWLIESKHPVDIPSEPEVQYQEQLADGSAARYVETTNQRGQVNQFLFFKRGSTYVLMEYLQSNAPYSDWQMVRVANSLEAVTQASS
ncbi:MAG: hypothetical protein K6T78_04500 [Alicyclobacillus sp.]|nr:hypothetical protein [Alicyclobacillus sp.]